MRPLLALACVSLVAACDSSPMPPGADVVGPFSGPTHRFVVDSITLPATRNDDRDDLGTGNLTINQLGDIVQFLATEKDLSTAAPSMLAAGALTPVVEIQANDPSLQSDDHVGVTFFGADGEAADTMGAVATSGTILSNRTRSTTHPASATLHLPLLADADPVAVHAIGLEIDLTPDGKGGYDAILRGGIDGASIGPEVYRTMLQMLEARPVDHLAFATLLDSNRDGTLTMDEVLNNTLIRIVIAPSVSFHDANGAWHPGATTPDDVIPFGFAMHLTPCASGRCGVGTLDQCTDRVKDGDESDVDCGGSCIPCPAASACAKASDCQTASCNAAKCAAPTCSDGLRDGFETDVDCGHECQPCATGKTCVAGGDCATNMCSTTMLLGVGTCVSM